VKIRWKLFLSLFLLTSLISVVLLAGVEYEYRQWVARQVTDNFSRRVDALLTGRRERLAEVRETARKLAVQPVVADALMGKATPKQRQELLESFDRIRSGSAANPPADANRSGNREGTERQPAGGATVPARDLRSAGAAVRQLPVIGVSSLSGEVQFFGRSATVRNQRRREATAEALEELRKGDEPLVSYVVTEGESGPGSVREVVVMPVEQDQQQLGWFFLGMNAETPVERAFQEIEDAVGRGIRSGLVVADEWFVPGVDDAVLRELATQVGNELWIDGEPTRVWAGGNEYLLIARDLNPGSPLGKGYQIGIFPLADLRAAIGRLRWAAAGMTLAALAVAGMMAMVIARRFSRPIDELVKGTVRVREGDFESKVRVESKDEFGTLAASFNVMTRELGLKEKYHDLLGKTSDPGLVHSLLEGRIELGGELRRAAVLFCDIRGFTAMTDGMNPAEVIDLLNHHMMAMTRVIHEHGGVVDKFVGDLVMAVFGVPVGRGDDLRRAIDCAAAMQDERERLNRLGPRAIETGIGLAWGEVVAGMMGSPERMNYTVLGERVNLAARLCSAAGAGEIMVDRATVDAAGDAGRFERRDELPMKGFKVPVELWAVKRRA
jgi:class 3 adenylate cyclase/HAMP domain-containing protein